MWISEKCSNNNKHNNYDNPLTSRRTDGGKKCDIGWPFNAGQPKTDFTQPYWRN